VDWLVFFVAVPQLQQTYELRLRYAEQMNWDCLIYVDGQLRCSFSGDGATSANDLWSRVFTAIGVSDGMVASGD
jgi:hypothetical protein